MTHLIKNAVLGIALVIRDDRRKIPNGGLVTMKAKEAIHNDKTPSFLNIF